MSNFSSESVENYAKEVAKIRMAAICQSLGWNSTYKSSMEVTDDFFFSHFCIRLIWLHLSVLDNE